MSTAPRVRRARCRGPSAAAASASTATAGAEAWAHAPTGPTLFWMAVSLPLVVWDSVYVLLRPWTMAGGALHWPLWVPYVLYGEVDHIYGWPALRAFNGFTSAQGFMNAIETAMYGLYLYIYLARGRKAAGAGGNRVIAGRPAATAALVGFSAAVMTFSKSVLYCTLLAS